ncbi:MAG: hypothetical protein LBI13_05865 [Streptococcaceae bacterium]|jgi:hypothetical protein|nr:hypothetical protein [Streptococcaceae bacterium]
MKKRTKIILGISIPIILFTGGIAMMQMKTPFDIFLTHDFTVQSKENTKQMQINFLKKHEQEMIDFVKAQNPKVTSVQFDWDSVKTGQIGNGTPQGGGDALTISGKFNEIDNSNVSLWFQVGKTGIPEIGTMELNDNLRIGKNLYE